MSSCHLQRHQSCAFRNARGGVIEYTTLELSFFWYFFTVQYRTRRRTKRRRRAPRGLGEWKEGSALHCGTCTFTVARLCDSLRTRVVRRYLPSRTTRARPDITVTPPPQGSERDRILESERSHHTNHVWRCGRAGAHPHRAVGAATRSRVSHD